MPRLYSLALALALITQPVHAEALYSDLVVFGDSLSDNGNLYEITNGFVPQSPPYWQGRFSNGPVWAEHLAGHLQLDPDATSNFAIGGLETGGVLDFEVIPYLEDGPAPADALYVLWAGPNDFLGGFGDPQLAVSEAVGNLQQSIELLAAAGAVDVLVPNMPNLGATPRFVGSGDPDDIADMQQVSIDFNNALDDMLDTVGPETGANIFKLDVYDLFEQLIAEPELLSLTNVTEPALMSNGEVVPDPDEYLFFDDVHPTRVIHQALGELAFNSIPEPQTFILLCAGMSTLIRRRCPRGV